jgi:aryl-alcohol dehydrogenase-like predicted oxidoreductase
MYAWQFVQAQERARAAGWTPFVSMQNHYNLAYREEEREMLPYCRETGVGVLPFSPLARGLLAGTRSREDRTTTVRGRSDPLAEATYGEGDFDVVDALVDVAAARGLPPAQVALAWRAGRPGVTAPIVGATKIGHVADAIASVAVTLDQDELARLEAPYRPHPVLGHD